MNETTRPSPRATPQSYDELEAINGRTNPPAFPQPKDFYDAYPDMRGMMLIDYFAAKALQGILSAGGVNGLELISESDYKVLARIAYDVATSMLKTREGLKWSN